MSSKAAGLESEPCATGSFADPRCARKAPRGSCFCRNYMRAIVIKPLDATKSAAPEFETAPPFKIDHCHRQWLVISSGK
jgi:hypothetical protein